MARVLWLIVGFIVGCAGALVWAWITYFWYASGSHCPGNDPDPIFACYPSFEQAPGAWIIQYGGMLLIVAFALFIFDLAGQGWKARRSKSDG